MEKETAIQSKQVWLQPTRLLDVGHPRLRALVAQRGWRDLPEGKRVQAVYRYVRDEVLFGYNASEAMPASAVLAEGYGQCNTKSTLLMALLRAVGIPCRIHGFTIDKALQKGTLKGIWYRLAPRKILHSWVEVGVRGEWYFLEGVILDQEYLRALQVRFADCEGAFCGYGVYTEGLADPQVDWDFNHTFIQRLGIEDDFGVYDDPDGLYAEHRQELNPAKAWIYRHVVRHLMNRNVARIRKSVRV